MCDQLDRAVYAVAHEFPGGIPALAARINARPGTLQNKVDPAMPAHRLNIFETRAITLVSGDNRIIEALAMDCGLGVYRLGDWRNCADMELLLKITELGSRRGDLDRSIHDALADGVIEPHERDEIEAMVRAEITANLELLSRISALARAEAESRQRRSR